MTYGISKLKLKHNSIIYASNIIEYDEKDDDLSLAGYYIIDNAILLKITIEYRNQIDFGNPVYDIFLILIVQ